MPLYAPRMATFRVRKAAPIKLTTTDDLPSRPDRALMGHALAPKTRNLASLLGRPYQSKCGLHDGARLLRRAAQGQTLRTLQQGRAERLAGLRPARDQRAPSLHGMRHSRLCRHALGLERGYRFQQGHLLTCHGRGGSTIRFRFRAAVWSRWRTPAITSRSSQKPSTKPRNGRRRWKP